MTMEELLKDIRNAATAADKAVEAAMEAHHSCTTAAPMTAITMLEAITSLRETAKRLWWLADLCKDHINLNQQPSSK
jgi:vacuolar-type H+-ATPase subunit H